MAYKIAEAAVETDRMQKNPSHWFLKPCDEKSILLIKYLILPFIFFNSIRYGYLGLNEANQRIPDHMMRYFMFSDSTRVFNVLIDIFLLFDEMLIVRQEKNTR